MRHTLPKARLTTPEGRAHFPYVHKPDTYGQYADGKFKITVSFPADSPFVEVIEAKVKELMTEHWGKRLPANAMSPVRFGDDTRMENLYGRMFLRAKSAHPPIVVDADKKPLPEGYEVVDGDTVRVALVLQVYEAGISKGVLAYLVGVQQMQSSWKAVVDDMFD